MELLFATQSQFVGCSATLVWRVKKNIARRVGWIAMTFGVDIYGPQRKKDDCLCEALMFYLAQQSGERCFSKIQRLKYFTSLIITQTDVLNMSCLFNSSAEADTGHVKMFPTWKNALNKYINK